MAKPRATIASYLQGSIVALRAIDIGDVDDAMAWYEGGYPASPERAETYLRDQLSGLTTSKALLAIIDVQSEKVVGGVRLRLKPRHAEIIMQMAAALDNADYYFGEALKLLVPWLRDEGQHITVTVDIPADFQQSVAAAEVVGMVGTARLREWYIRGGQRVDKLIYQAIHPEWREAGEAHA